MDQFRRHETCARDYMSDAGDDCELIPPDTLLIPFSYVRVSQPADRVLQVGLTRASIEPMMLLGTFRPMSNRCARKPLTLRDYRCSLRTVHLEQGSSVVLLLSVVHMGVMPVPSSLRKVRLEPTARALSEVQLAHPTAARPTWRTPNPTDCGGGLRSPLSLALPTWEACRSTITRDKMTSLIWMT
jgi:hypothetical protein